MLKSEFFFAGEIDSEFSQSSNDEHSNASASDSETEMTKGGSKKRGKTDMRRLIKSDFREEWDESDNDDEVLDRMDKAAERFTKNYGKQRKPKCKKEP